MARKFDEKGHARLPNIEVFVNMYGVERVTIDGEDLGWTSDVQIDLKVGSPAELQVTLPADTLRIYGPASYLVKVESWSKPEIVITPEPTTNDCHACGAALQSEARFCSMCGASTKKGSL